MYLLLLAPPDSNSYQFWSSRRLARRRPFCGSVEFVLSLCCSPAQCRRCVRKFGGRDKTFERNGLAFSTVYSIVKDSNADLTVGN